MKINSINTNAMSMQEARNAQPSIELVKNDNVSDEKLMDVYPKDVINDVIIENSVKEANKNLAKYNRMIERVIHEKTHTIIYILKDTLTNEVIEEFPSRKIQDMIAKMWEMAGLIVDERR